MHHAGRVCFISLRRFLGTKKNMGLMQFYDSCELSWLIRNGNIESNLSDDDDAERLELNVFGLQHKKEGEKS